MKKNRLFEHVGKPIAIPVDAWVPEPEDLIINHTKGAMVIPITDIVYGKGYDDVENINLFSITAKRCYMNIIIRGHISHYLNYFLKFYDEDKELLSIYTHIKCLIDYNPNYTKYMLMYDIQNLILNGSLSYKLTLMNRDNYMNDFNKNSIKNDALRYTNKHGMILMKASLTLLVIIPIITHFIQVNKITNVDETLLEFFSPILYIHDADIYAKIFETVKTKVSRNVKNNPLWGMQDIRAVNPTIHMIDTVNTIILHIMPRYFYDGSSVGLNLKVIDQNARYKVLDIGYGCDFIPISSSKRDEDNNSEFDKFESYLIKQDESLYLQNKVNCDTTMDRLESMYGPFKDEEVQYYKTRLSDEGEFTINSFQRELVFNPFYKFFGDSTSIKGINSDDYIKLMIIGKNMLESYGLKILPYILTGKVVRITNRKNVNKQELIKLEKSPKYDQVLAKYQNEKIVTNILSTIATILSSEFHIIDYNQPEMTGVKIECPTEMLCDELLTYILLI